MTMGQLRQTLFTIWLVIAGATFLADSVLQVGNGRLFGIPVISFFPLVIPTVRIGRIQGSTPLTGLGLTLPSVVYFLLGLALPVLLSVHAILGAAALVGLLVTYVWFERAARAAIQAGSEALHTSRGDADFGVFTALTPMAPPPTARPEPTSMPEHTRYDPAAVRDPMEGLTRRARDR